MNMPVYEYYCSACDTAFDKYHKTMEAKKPPCPDCGKKSKVKRAVTGHSFIKDERTKMNEMHPKYAQMVDDVWDRSRRADPLTGTRFERDTDSGIRMQDVH